MIVGIGHRFLVNHAFKGGRFEDHGLDVDVVGELVRYKDLLAEVAKELWRRAHPERKNLPPNFEASLRLRFFSIQPGSTVVPLERVVCVEDESLFGQEPDELDLAVELVSDVVTAAERNDRLPDAFPKPLLAKFDEYGKSLRGDEWIELGAKDKPVAKYDATSRGRLMERAASAYEDEIDVVGAVNMARVNRPRMGIELPDGKEVEAQFEQADKKSILAALEDHESAKIRVRGRGRFSPEGQLQKILRVDQVTLLPTGEIPHDPAAKPIWEEFEEITKTMSPELVERLPVDGAEQHDHYTYGSPKRPR